jgi:hypothetical protein
MEPPSEGDDSVNTLPSAILPQSGWRVLGTDLNRSESGSRLVMAEVSTRAGWPASGSTSISKATARPVLAHACKMGLEGISSWDKLS